MAAPSDTVRQGGDGVDVDDLYLIIMSTVGVSGLIYALLAVTTTSSDTVKSSHTTETVLFQGVLKHGGLQPVFTIGTRAL